MPGSPLGFIGSNLVDELVALGGRVSVIDDLSTGRLFNLDAALERGVTLHQDDVRDGEALRYLRGLGVLALLLAGGATVAFFGLRWSGRFHGLSAVHDFFASPTTLHVSVLGLAGYALLVWALYNAVFLMSVGARQPLLRALAAGVVTTLLVGFVLSRLLAYWTSAAGLTAGALVYALLSGRSTLRVLRTMDYHSFAAH